VAYIYIARTPNRSNRHWKKNYLTKTPRTRARAVQARRPIHSPAFCPSDLVRQLSPIAAFREYSRRLSWDFTCTFSY